MREISDEELCEKAIAARDKSYCPYSGFSVGAALLTKSGKVYLGANIENAAYTPTICAERVAIFKAVSDGEREFSRMAIAGAKVGTTPTAPVSPCGVCRQVMSEFCAGDLVILCAYDGGCERTTLGEMLPKSFDKTVL